MMKKTVTLGVSLAICLSGTYLRGVEYFVSKQGNDANTGLSREAAFLTIQKGVDALEAGDTLTIEPGEYFGAVKRQGLGDEERDTTIRAAMPGTVLIRGDVPAPEFKPVPGYRFLHVADFAGDVEAVAETDTLKILDIHPGREELDLRVGACHYDAEAGKLYISSSDLKSPAEHKYTVMVTSESGLRLDDPRRVRVEGIAVTGFYRNGSEGLNFAKSYIWGIVFTNPENCTVSDCIVYLNAGGICMTKGQGNIIEKCDTYGNSNLFGPESGGIFRVNGNNDIIRNCRAFRSMNAGIRYYLALSGPCVMRDNIAWGNLGDDFWIKVDGTWRLGYAERCVAGGKVHIRNVTNCLHGATNAYRWDVGTPDDSVELTTDLADWRIHYADPDNFDFRLQSNSSLRGKGPEGSDSGPYPYNGDVFFVSPEGDDAADGTAVELAWRSLEHATGSLKEGDTLYLLPGVYDEGLTLSAKNIAIRGRGTEAVVIKGAAEFKDCNNVKLERLNFATSCKFEGGRGIKLDNCTAADFGAAGTKALTAVHCIFGSTPLFSKCEGLHLWGNIFATGFQTELSQILYSDYNSYADVASLEAMPDRYSQVIKPEFKTGAKTGFELANAFAFAGAGPNGTAVGPYRFFTQEQIKLAGPWVYSVGDNSADIEWYTDRSSICELSWGDTPERSNKVICEIGGYGTISLTGLKPSTSYYFKVNRITPQPVAGFSPEKDLFPEEGAITFQTAAQAEKERTRFVALDGDDSNDGLTRQTAWKTVSRAAAGVKPGDTVLVGEGSYKETVQVRVSGTEGRPVTFKAAPGERVVFDGGNRELINAFIIDGKQFVHCDGFYFKGYGSIRGSGIFKIANSRDITITRCMMDGRGIGYSPSFLRGRNSERVTVKNSVIANGFSGMGIVGCSELRLENNVFMRNLIMSAVLVNQPHQKMYLSRNIFTDGLPVKVGAPVFEIGKYESFFERDNCYYLRPSEIKKKMFRFYGGESYARCARLYGWDEKGEEDAFFDDLTDLDFEGYKKYAGETGSILGNPVFRCTLTMGREGEDVTILYMTDRVMNRKDLDFADLFTTDEEMVAKGIGLEPEAFADFWFNKGDGE